MDAFAFDGDLWLHDGDAPWHFITVPQDISDNIEARQDLTQRGFGSVRVRVTIGATTWTTSLFPDIKREAYVLPVKRDVRESEGIAAGSTVGVRIELVDAP